MHLSENIKSEILSHTVSEKNRKIGLEVEGLYYNTLFSRLPVNPTNQYSATDLVEEIQKKRQPEDPFTYSLEPGGQLEWASAPAISLWDIQKQFDRHVELENHICKNHHIYRLYLSLEPFCEPNDIDLITLNKYQLMHNLFIQTGRMGPWMMRNTTSVQLNIDYTSEKDANEMAFAADAIQPLFSILFSNSPFMRGEPVETTNMRWKIWEDTDPDRCGSLFNHGIYSPHKMVDDYANWLPGVKTIFKYNENGEAEYFNGTLGEMILSEPRASKSHVVSALHQSFTHVRFKKVLEVRASDRPPKGMEMAPAAFLAGLLTGVKVRSNLLKTVSRWSPKERKNLIGIGNDLSFTHIGPENKTVGEWLEFLSSLALNGLDEREKLFEIKNERPLVQPFLEDVLSNGPKSIQMQIAFRKEGGSLKAFLKDYCLDSVF
jgi:glutamate--cysteine ligase